MSSRSAPMDVPSLVRYPSRKIVHIVLAMENRQGMIAEVADVVSGANGNILWGAHSVEPGSNAGVWGFYVDLSQSSVEVEELKDRLARIKGVADVSLKGERGVLVKHPGFPIYTEKGEENNGGLESRAVMMTLPWLQSVIGAMKERFGSGGNAIVFYLGLDGGRASVRKFMDSGFRDLAAIEACLQLDQALGWGVFTVSHSDLNKKTFTVAVREGAECSEKTNGKPNMVLMRGYVTGIFSEAFGKEFQAEEVKCVARGDRHCELLLGPK